MSLAYTWLRPGVYRATARVEITPGTTVAPGTQPGSVAASPFLTEVQVLTSRPLLEEVAARLERDGPNPSQFGADPVAGMQARLAARPVPQTNIVELVATGSEADALAPLVNATIDVYQQRLAQAYESTMSESLAQVDDEAKRLESTVAAKRLDLEAFRHRNNIVMPERDENQVVAQARNLSSSLNAANDKVAAAESRLRALNQSAKSSAGALTRDDPALASLEQRASQLREELRDIERIYTGDFLAKEPKAIELRRRLAELERQISVQREENRKAALVAAQEELANATAAAERIQGQLTSGRAEVVRFTTRYSEYKARLDDLTNLEKALRDARQKQAMLEASERARVPVVKVIETAGTPLEPWQPLYWRDTGIAAGASLVLALLVMALVEFFNRTEPQPSVVVVRPQRGGLSYEGRVDALTLQSAPQALGRTEPALLAAQPRLPRELGRDEVAALIQASDASSRLVVLLLLSGVTADEAIATRVGDVDLARGIVRVGGAGRDVALGDAPRAEVVTRMTAAASDPLIGQAASPATRESIDAQILCAAHDAGLDDPASVNADSLRHTYVAYLVRQGIRFADLTSLVGELPAGVLGAYTNYAPPGPRVARERIETSYPGVRANVAG